MSLARTNTPTPLAATSHPPGYVPLTPEQANANPKARLEKGFVREAIKPRGNSRLHRQLIRQQEAREVAGEYDDLDLEDLALDRVRPADAFCFLLKESEIQALLDEMASTRPELEAFQNMISGKSYNLVDARSFARKWSGVPRPHKGGLVDLPGYKILDQQATALKGAEHRINFVHSQYDRATHQPKPEYDLGALVKPEEEGSGTKPEVAGILNAASRSGWGKKGASKAIQDGAASSPFKRLQKALYKRRTNLVGNAPVGQAYVVPVSDDKVVFSVAGPNHKHHTGLRLKVPRLSHRFKPDHVSQSQERKLRAAYRTFFASVDQYNADVDVAGNEAGKDRIQQLHMVPISANVFGFPKDRAARIMAEEVLRYAAQNPDIRIQVLAVNDQELARYIKIEFEALGAACAEETGVPKPV